MERRHENEKTRNEPPARPRHGSLAAADVRVNAAAEETAGQVNEDGYVPFEATKTWSTTDVETWNNGTRSIPAGYPAIDDTDVQLYYKDEGGYVPVKTERFTNYYKQIASPANPLEFIPANWNNFSASTSDNRDWNKDNGYNSGHYVKGDDGKYYALKYHFERHTSFMNVLNKYLEICPYYVESNTINNLFGKSDTRAWTQSYYTQPNSYPSAVRNFEYDGFYDHTNEPYEHNAFKYDVYDLIANGNMIWFDTSSEYQNLSGNKNLLALSESNADAVYTGTLYFKAKNENPNPEIPDEDELSGGDTAGTPEDDSLKLTKTLKLNDDGTYSIVLESYATGAYQESTTETAVPADIILVLDQSGSMEYNYEMGAGYVNVDAVSYDNINNGDHDYFLKFDGEDTYYPLHVRRKTVGVLGIGNHFFTFWYGDEQQDHYLSFEAESKMVYSNNTLNGKRYKLFYYQNSGTVQRIDALRTAVNTFLEELEGNVDAYGNPIYRAAVTGFANQSADSWSNTEVFNGPKQYKYNELPSRLSQVTLKWADEGGVATLKQSVAALEADGGTYSNRGLELAEQILNARPANEKNRRAVVILFTDGAPGYTGADSTVANDAITVANRLKHEQDATVFSVGIFTSDIGSNAKIGSYEVRDYMQAVSSMYPDATSMGDKGNPASGGPYYSCATGAAGSETSLTQIFQTIENVIKETTTPVTLDTSAILQDVIDKQNFTFANNATEPTVTVQTVASTHDTEGNPTGWDTDYPDTKTVTWNDDSVTTGWRGTKTADTVKVQGFDYADQFVAKNHQGSNLLPNRAYDPSEPNPNEGESGYVLPSNVSAAIFANTTDLQNDKPAAAVNRPWTTIAERTVMIDYDMTYELANGQYAKLSGTPTHTYGTFDAAGQKVTYKLDTGTIASTANTTVDLAFNGVDSALVYGKQVTGTDANGDVQTEETATWKKVNVIPASCIYYDDSLSEVSGTTDGSSNSSLVIPTQGDTDELSRGKHTYTFYGTGIDVYCTTYDTIGEGENAMNVGTITAKLEKNGETVYENMYNYSPEMRYNVPTVFFHDLPLGEYTLTLSAYASSNYKIDGIRVYNPMADQSKYAEKTEQYAAYVNLRDALVNNPDTNIETYTVNGSLDAADLTQGTGVLFMDNPEYLTSTVPEIDMKTGEEVKDADGNTKMVKVYNDTFTAYKDLGPKNEIYLDAGQAITFTLTSAANGGKLWLGLSAPNADETTGTVSVNGETQSIDVTSAMDMYYPVTKNGTGSYTIKNEGDHLIAITNLKITGVQSIYEVAAAGQTTTQGNGGEEGQNANTGGTAASVEDVVNMVFEPVTLRTVKLAANNGVDPDAVVTPDPEPEKPGWNDNAYNPVELLKALFKLLLESLSNLFSGLGNW